MSVRWCPYVRVQYISDIEVHGSFHHLSGNQSKSSLNLNFRLVNCSIVVVGLSGVHSIFEIATHEKSHKGGFCGDQRMSPDSDTNKC